MIILRLYLIRSDFCDFLSVFYYFSLIFVVDLFSKHSRYFVKLCIPLENPNEYLISHIVLPKQLTQVI